MSHASWKFLPNTTCGNSAPVDRIIGGTKATLGQYPWLVRLGYSVPCRSEPIFQCAGTLINERYVVTAGHCVHNLPQLKCPDGPVTLRL